MGYILYDTELIEYDDPTVDYEGVEDYVEVTDEGITSPVEYELLSFDDTGPSDPFSCLEYNRIGIHFACDDSTDEIIISVSNDGINYVNRLTITGPDIQMILGPWKYIKATRTNGNGSVRIVLSQDLWFK